METLQQIYDKLIKEYPTRLTDKGAGAYGPIEGGPGHTYAQFYDILFGKFRDKPINILEIGVNRGGSLMMWRRFFNNPETRVYGIDIVKSFDDFPPEENINAYVFDAGSPGLFQQHLQDTKFDIIIDDGAHEKESQVKIYNLLKNRVKSDGLYVIEDIFEVHNNIEYFLERVTPVPTVIDRRWINEQLDDVMLVFRF
jgi:hypothetical protein